MTLRRCLELKPPANLPGPNGAHYRIGMILEKKGDANGARTEYEAALKLDPSMKQASEALAKLKP